MKSMKARILVIDDEGGIRSLLKQELTEVGYMVETAADGLEAVEKVAPGRFQLAISDLNMPKMGGIEAMCKIREIDPDIEFILMTGFASVESAVAAMKNGAYDYIQKPFNLDEILILVEKSLEKSEMRTMMGVYEASRSVFRSVQLDTLLTDVVNVALKVLKAESVSVLIPDESARFEVKAAAGAKYPAFDSDAEEMFKSKKPILQETRIIYPLVIEDELLGIIDIHRSETQEHFSAMDMRYTTVLGSQIAQAIHNAKLYARLESVIQELKATQNMLIQSEKMVSMGQLAAGVAHELNNPLTGIHGFTELLLDDDNLSQQHRKDLEIVRQQSRRCRTIIQNLLHFSRRSDTKKEVHDLSALIDSALALIYYEFSTSGIKIIKKIPENLPKVMVDAAKIEQVFINLLTNARQAMASTPHPSLTIEAGQTNSQAYIRFIDNGPGVPQEIIGKIFDPFFTTKSVGEGTGLGLSICYGIIQQHAGKMVVENLSERGAAFTVELPVYEN